MTTLSSWGLDATAWTAAQVVSELATNCTLHARSDFAVRLSVEGESLRVEATDGVVGGLHARQYSSTATTGRGLRIVASLSSAWGVVPTDDGKTVWALLPLEDLHPARDDGDERLASGAAAPAGEPAPAGPLAQAAGDSTAAAPRPHAAAPGARAALSARVVREPSPLQGRRDRQGAQDRRGGGRVRRGCERVGVEQDHVGR